MEVNRIHIRLKRLHPTLFRFIFSKLNFVKLLWHIARYINVSDWPLGSSKNCLNSQPRGREQLLPTNLRRDGYKCADLPILCYHQRPVYKAIGMKATRSAVIASQVGCDDNSFISQPDCDSKAYS